MAWHENDDFWVTFGPVLFNQHRLAAAPAEVEGIVGLLSPPPGARILDMACGPGRHTLELARRGFEVTGVDRTTRYLQQLSTAAREQDLSVEVVRRDMRDFRRPQSFDAAMVWFTSLGYFDDPEDDRRVLVNLRDSLVPGGKLVLDLLGKEIVARGHVERWWKWLQPDVLLLEEREVTKNWSWLQTRWTLIEAGQSQKFSMAQRLWSASELESELERTGFTSIRIYGGLNGEPYNRSAWRLIAVAERPE